MKVGVKEVINVIWCVQVKVVMKEVMNVQYCACMNPTAGSFTITPRMQRHFATFAVQMPSVEILRCVALRRDFGPGLGCPLETLRWADLCRGFESAALCRDFEEAALCEDFKEGCPL